MGWVLSNKTAFQVRRSLELSVVVAAIRSTQVVFQTRTQESFSGILRRIAKILVQFFIRFAM
jgi:hypothetical protein